MCLVKHKKYTWRLWYVKMAVISFLTLFLDRNISKMFKNLKSKHYLKIYIFWTQLAVYFQNFLGIFRRYHERLLFAGNSQIKSGCTYFPIGIFTGTPLTKTVAESLATGFCEEEDLAWLRSCCSVCIALAVDAFEGSLAHVPDLLQAGGGAGLSAPPVKSIFTSDWTLASKKYETNY